MFRYVLVFSLLCATALGATTAPVTQRKARSIWPFSSSDASAESPITDEHALMLQQAGLDKSFNLSSHPLWKIHKYHGIDLKPVQIQTEIIKSEAANGGVSPTPSVGSNTQPSGDETGATSELPDLSFLNDLGGLADFLPDPEEDEASELIANAIEKEESSHPGFFKRLWWKIWGTPESSNATMSSETSGSSTFGFLSSLFGFGQSQQDAKEEGKDGEEALTIYLPETQGSYVAVVLPTERPNNPSAPQQNILLPSQVAPPLFRQAVTSVAQVSGLPPNHANEYRDATAVATASAATAHLNVPIAKPVAQWPVPGSTESHAWIQSWTPHAAYTVHVQGPSSQPPKDQSHAGGNYEAPPLPEPNLSPPSEESRPQAEQPSSAPSNELEPPAPTEPSYNPQILAHDVPPVLEAFENAQNEQQASRKSSHDLAAEDGEEKNQRRDPVKNDKDSGEAANKASHDSEKLKEILSHFRIPEGLMKKLQVSQKDVENILNDKESAARAAERLRSLQKEFEMRKEQLSYVYATRVKKQLE